MTNGKGVMVCVCHQILRAYLKDEWEQYTSPLVLFITNSKTPRHAYSYMRFLRRCISFSLHKTKHWCTVCYWDNCTLVYTEIGFDWTRWKSEIGHSVLWETVYCLLWQLCKNHVIINVYFLVQYALLICVCKKLHSRLEWLLVTGSHYEFDAINSFKNMVTLVQPN